MSTLCKARALYVKATVIQCGVPDYHGDILDSEAIKKVFTSFNNQNRFDIHHNRIPVDDVSLLENYISKSDEEIAGTLVPSGSWNVVLRVDNPVIQEKIMNRELQGVSLTTAIKEECRAGFTKTGNITYRELPEAECWLPVFISLVTEPANLVGLHVMDYTVYIEKSKHNSHIHKFGGKTLSFLDKLKTLIAEEEASHPVIEKSTGEENKEEVTTPVDENIEEPVVEKAATDEKEEATDDKEEVVEETVKEEEDKKEEEVVEKAEDPQAEAEAEEASEEVEEVKEEVDLEAKIADLEARIAELEKQINKAEPTTESEPVEATTEDKVDDQPVITKSKRIEVTNETTNTSNFYELSGRDPVTGKKIRPKTKVLN